MIVLLNCRCSIYGPVVSEISALCLLDRSFPVTIQSYELEVIQFIKGRYFNNHHNSRQRSHMFISPVFKQDIFSGN